MIRKHDRHALELLDQAGLRRTPGRVQLLALLLGAQHPLSHQELRDGSGLSRVALYRALDAFHAAGIVHRVDAGERLWRFAVCGCGHSVHCHPHFTCRVCGEVECLNEIALPAIDHPGIVIEEQEVYLRGVCRQCAAAAKGQPPANGPHLP